MTCNTANAGSSELPAGYYSIGDYLSPRNQRTPWFNLYRQRSSDGGFWDYYTQAFPSWAVVVDLVSIQAVA